MVMANAARTANCRRRSVKGKVLSEGVSAMRGISTCLPLCRPVQISALITFGCSRFTTSSIGWIEISHEHDGAVYFEMELMLW